MSIPAHIKYIVLTILFVLASVNFIKTAFEIIQNSKRLDSITQEVDKLSSDKQNLEESISYKKTSDYIEEKARNDLNMIKPGEKVYVAQNNLYTNEYTNSKGSNVLGVSGTADARPSFGRDGKLGYLALWIDLFFN